MEMGVYEEWNRAIAEYFTAGVPKGTPVYLSVDEEALVDIGSRLAANGREAEDYVNDFTDVVRRKCVSGDEVRLDLLTGMTVDKLPECVAFLAAMVMAAHNMREEEDEEQQTVIGDNNYFKRLREVLGLPMNPGRPCGMVPAGIEEGLWREWNRWLVTNGWLPSAEAGPVGAMLYLNYPLSQALLRKSDRIRLEKLFEEEYEGGRLSRSLGRDSVALWLLTRSAYLAPYLRRLVEERLPRRRDAVFDAVFQLYSSIDWIPDAKPGTKRVTLRRLDAGLYRYEDPIEGTIVYRLYPKQPRMQWRGSELSVVRNGQAYPLITERSGWFRSLKWSEDPAGGKTYEVEGDERIKELVLPERSFWILVRDPDNERSGELATWRQPSLGENFLLLCRDTYVGQLELMQREGLLAWQEAEEVLDGWYEYRECMVLSRDWDVLTEQSDLCEALRPKDEASIVLVGGLQAPQRQGWIVGHQPEIIPVAFEDYVTLQVLDVQSLDEPFLDEDVRTGEPTPIQSLDPGDYLLQILTRDRLAAQRSLKIVRWDDLDVTEPEEMFCTSIDGLSIRGAIVS